MVDFAARLGLAAVMSLRLFALFGLILGTLFAGQARAAGPCHTNADVWSAQGLANAEAAYAMPWTPFGSTEWGWRPYLPLIQHELHTRCGAGTPIFASQLAGFQQTHGLAPTGLLDAATFQVFRGVWQERRPFVMARVGGLCPEPPPINQLGYLVAEEEHADRLTRLLRRDVLDAYRRLVAAARAEVPEVAANPELLQIFSGFRDPEADAARCAQQGNCDGLRRAVCSPHRTGTAVDLYVGQAPGLGVDSTSPASREYMAQTETYRWLVENVGRFGFTPYVFEPWHWEYVRPWDPLFAP